MFMFRLALKLGCTVAELQDRMSYNEFVEWSVYYRHEPWGSEINDLRNAVVASTVANSGLMMADPKRLKSRPFKPSQFMTSPKKDSIDSKVAETKSSLFNIMAKQKRR